MEGFELVAILIYIIIAGLIGLSRYIQGQTSEDDTSTDDPESSRPVYTPTHQPGPGRAEPQRYDSPYQRQTQTQQRPPQPMPHQESPYQRRPPQPQPAPQRPAEPEDDPLKPMRDMLKEIFGAEEPEIVEERPKKRMKKRRRPKQTQEAPKPALENMLEPVRISERPASLPSRSPFFEQLAKDATENPLRSAVIFTEILKRPRAIRSAPMFYIHER